MSILGIGLDVTSKSRIARCLERYEDRFADRLFHPDEMAYARQGRNPAEFLAACFAVKEAMLKALGDFHHEGLDWLEMVVRHEPSGKPVLDLTGKAQAFFHKKGGKKIHLSITHDADLAIAQVILED
jgi:holo-[acyl-carrier protein] synthase